MKLTPIVAQLRAQCPLFQARIGGALEFEPVRESSYLPAPAAYVVMTGDEAQPSEQLTGIQQTLRDSFDVVTHLTTVDERGQSLADAVHEARAELCRALVGWRPTPDMEPIQYEGGALLQLDRKRMWYRFGFYTSYLLGGGAAPETWEEQQLAALPPLEGIDFKVERNIRDEASADG